MTVLHMRCSRLIVDTRRPVANHPCSNCKFNLPMPFHTTWKTPNRASTRASIRAGWLERDRGHWLARCHRHFDRWRMRQGGVWLDGWPGDAGTQCPWQSLGSHLHPHGQPAQQWRLARGRHRHLGEPGQRTLRRQGGHRRRAHKAGLSTPGRPIRCRRPDRWQPPALRRRCHCPSPGRHPRPIRMGFGSNSISKIVRAREGEAQTVQMCGKRSRQSAWMIQESNNEPAALSVPDDRL